MSRYGNAGRGASANPGRSAAGPAAQIALRRADVNELSRLVLRDGSTTIAGRFVGALQAIGRVDDARLVHSAMEAAGHRLRVTNPFVEH